MIQFDSSLFHKVNYALVIILVTLLCPLALAQVSPNPTINNKPIAIDADNQQINLQKNTITFTGNVVITQDDLKIKANTVIITDMQSKDNQIITAYGTPVYFEQTYQNDDKQTITGHANQLIYQVKQNSVTLLDKAELLQQDNRITSDKIVYDVEQQKIEAQPGNGNRVKTIIIPNQVKEIQR
ncbi:lipopolysaccharide transport periplasmic protein LptA [Orbus sturtevantii]|uniref:lipopolysaccharide transport periplasmic protein LptA n=1 Tax=Orbus sturtevantii TaxID=3074109 RepID=UPI00370D346A